MFKVAVIGAGYFGQRHIKLLSQMDDVEIVGIADKDIYRAFEVVKGYDIRCVEDFRELIDDAEIFFIVTPTITHFEIANFLIDKGKHLFIEKPITEKVEDAQFLINEALQKGVIFQVGLIERFNPAVRTLLEYVKNPLFINAQRLSPFLGRATDTDVTFDLMIHDIDLIWTILKHCNLNECSWIIKEIFKKSIVTYKIDYADVWLEFESADKQINANVIASRVSISPKRSITVIEEDCAFNADLVERKVFKIDNKGNSYELPVQNNNANPLYDEIRDFLQAIRENRFSNIAPSPKEIIEAIKIINQINGGEN
ncbi:Gfo/Idh/MocA family oxidoreductase [Thermodesulfovibrio hydrogeniphilus]